MTEAEMMETWCPDARVDSTAANRPSTGRDVNVEAGWPPCLGRKCSAWRWEVNVDGLGYSKTNGYCGRAGKP